jgi:subfamily B ATP-binding cassette protein MsbA
MENKKKRKLSLATIGYAFREIIWPRKYLVLLGLFLIIINRLSGLILPGSSKYLIDDVIAKGDHDLLVLLVSFCNKFIFFNPVA